MWFIIGSVILFLFLASFILPWIVRARVAALQSEVAELRSRMNELEGGNRSHSFESVSRPEPEPFVAPAMTPKPAEYVQEQAPASRYTPTPEPIQPAYAEHPKLSDTIKESRTAGGGFEMQFGAKLPVWIGGIALALAGFYLVKYSIDVGILSPAVRLVIGTLFGFGLLAGGYHVRRKEGFSDGTRIAQALTGAGIADLYACIFTATSIYHLLPSTVGFLGMAAVTAAAVILSLRHGAPIAMLGMVGGFLTPALMGSDQPSAAMLFGYLYFVVTGLMLAVRRQGWWMLGLVTTAASFLWVVFWLVGGSFRATDAVWLCLFMLAVTATVFAISTWGTQEAKGETPPDKSVPLMNNTVAIAALAFCGVIMTKSGYGFMEWGMLWLISAGTLVMSWFRHQEYRALPWISMAVNGAMLALWYTTGVPASPLALVAFALLYVTGGVLLQELSNRPFYWGSLAMSAATGSFVLAYTTFENRMPTELWGLSAFVLALAGLCGVFRLMTSLREDDPQRKPLLTVYIAGVTAFVSLALMIVLERFYLSAAIAGEVLALSFIAVRVKLPNMKWIIGAVTGAFVLLSLQELVAGLWILIETVFGGSGGGSYTGAHMHPLIQFGLPALCFFGAALQWLRKEGDSRVVRSFEVLGILLTALAFHYVAKWVLYPGQDILHAKPGFLQRGIMTNVIFVGSIACLAFGHRFGRAVFTQAGVIIGLIAAFRICFLDLFMYNPIWDESQRVGHYPIFNATLVTFGLPLVWTVVLMRMAAHLRKESWMPKLGAFALLLSFMFTSFQVRQIFHGDILTGAAENGEIYTYSAVWLLFGMVLLFVGTLRKLRMLRIAALSLMVLTVGKVFLYDASALTGLYRVFSFFGLGLSLLGLSWFYTRFLLPQKK